MKLAEGKICSATSSSIEQSVGENRLAKVCPGGIGATQHCSAEITFFKARARQPGANQSGAREIGLIEKCAAQVALRKIGAGEIAF